MSKEAFITGVDGQDGSYLSELLLKEGYEVFGYVRDDNSPLPNLEHIRKDIRLVRGDLRDFETLVKAIEQAKPVEVYNLAARTTLKGSWDEPIDAAHVTALGAHNVFEAVKRVAPTAKTLQASSSQMYGEAEKYPQDESTPHNPINPYAVAKQYAHNMAGVYRAKYGVFIACAILFNHESPRRGYEFVTQKVTLGAACAKLGIKNPPYLNEVGEPIVKNGKIALGNMDSQRDWGYAEDFVRAMWLMLQQDKPDDFVIATGETHSIRELCDVAFRHVNLKWEDYIVIDPRLVRPTETVRSVGNNSKANKVLGWKLTVKFGDIIAMMVDAHLARLK